MTHETASPVPALLPAPSLAVGPTALYFSPARRFRRLAPYHYYQQENGHRELRGFAVEYLNAVSARLGCRLVYLERPWKRGCTIWNWVGWTSPWKPISLKRGRAMPGSPPPTTRGARHSGCASPVTRGAGSGELAGQGNRLGVTRDYNYGPEIARLLQRYRAQVSEVNDVQNYRKLQLGRIDGFLGDILATPGV